MQVAQVRGCVAILLASTDALCCVLRSGQYCCCRPVFRVPLTGLLGLFVHRVQQVGGDTDAAGGAGSWPGRNRRISRPS